MTFQGLFRQLICLIFFLGLNAYSEESARSSSSLQHLTLKMAEDLWQQKNLNIQIAKNQVEGAKADTLSAARRPNPKLSYYMNSIGAGRDHSYLNGSDQVIHIDQTFERGDKRELRMKSADLMLQASEADYESVKRLSKTQLYQLYYQLHLAQDKLKITEDNASLYEKTLEVSQLRFKAGDISAAELSRLDLDKLRADNEVIQARNNLKQAQIDLAIYIG
ncbi:MAG: TolC family protein, partial [Candidatus Methylopumilus sp.]